MHAEPDLRQHPTSAAAPATSEGRPDVVRIGGLHVSYRDVKALDGMELVLPAGAVGLLGPNGAGKTTLIKVLLGLLVPDRGEVRILGHDPRRAGERLRLRRRVGYMPESDCLMPGMSAVALVASLGRISGLAAADAMTRAHEVLYYVGLEEARYRDATQYSTGMRQRLKLAQALVHDPELLLLDEPTNGLDPKGRNDMLELIRDLGTTQGKSLLLCSHLLPDIERTCRHVVVIHRGRVVESGVIADLTRAKERWVRVEVMGDPARLERALRARGLVVELEAPPRLRVKLEEGRDDADVVFEGADEASVGVTRVEPVRPSLETVFLKLLEDARNGSP